MLFGFISGDSKEDETRDLCLVPDKPSFFSTPVKVLSLKPTEAAIHLLSNDEAVTVDYDQPDHGLIVAAVPPSPLYLTPNLPHRPGFQVDRVKILSHSNKEYTVFFDRGRGWESWTPNKRLY